jgi:lipid II:glycine glycyltransferase (peptidoglycan interpeptide bridge formation enzyme)
VLQDLAGYARSHASVFLKIDPELPRGFGLPGEDDSHLDFLGTEVIADLKRNGWQAAAPVQFQNSMRIDLRPSEAELLERMKPKTRYNLRLAARHGVTVRHAGPAELERLYPIFVETSVRDGFVIRNREYYLDVWGTFVSSGLAQPILAEVEGEAVAAVIVFRFGRTAYFLYGMSRDAHREKMPNYMLQWEAIRWARRQGCEVYDLWGAPDRADPKDPLWGVYRFKSGLGAHGVQWLGAWDYATGRPLYWLYSVFLPRVLAVLRSGRMAQVRRFME